MLIAFSVRLLRFADFFVDRLSAGEALSGVVPVRNSLFSQLPTQQHDVAVHFAGEIEQSDIKIFHLNAGGIDLSQCIFYSRDSFFALSLPASHVDHIDQQASLQENAVRQFLEFSVDGLDQFLAVKGGAQQRFEHRQERLGFFKGERSFGHMGMDLF